MTTATNVSDVDSARAAAGATTFLIVPGLYDSDAAHWQTRWQRRFGLPRVVQPDWNKPDIEVWAHTLETHVRCLPAPVVLLAHSFGCLATAFAASRLRERVLAALLVAPADPDKFSVTSRLSTDALPFTSLVVASRNDPWMRFERVRWWAEHWGSRLVDLGAVGHINSDSGLGEWDEGWSLAQSLTPD